MGRDWVPALGRWRSVEAYQRLVRRFSLDDLPRQVARDLECESGMSVLELGCGPGTLASALFEQTADVRFVGLDPDDQMLAHARSHVENPASWVLGVAQRLPFPDATFDRISTTLVLHHLTRTQKAQALAEAFRTLRPGGSLFVTDWTRPRGTAAAGFLLVRAVDGFAQTADHAAGRLPEIIEAAGFRDITVLRRRDLCLGTITHLRALRGNLVSASPSPQAETLQQYAREGR